MRRRRSARRTWESVLAGPMLACAAALVAWYVYLLAPTAFAPQSTGGPTGRPSHRATDRSPADAHQTSFSWSSRAPRPLPCTVPLTTPPGRPVPRPYSMFDPQTHVQRPETLRPYSAAGAVRPAGYVVGPAEPGTKTSEPGAEPNTRIRVVPSPRASTLQDQGQAATGTASRPRVPPAGIARTSQRIPGAADEPAPLADESTADDRSRFKIPLAGSLPPGAVQVDPRTGLVTIAIRDAPLDQVLGILAEQQGLNIVCSEDVTAQISITIRNAPFEKALDAILSVAGYTARRQGDFLLITSVAGKGNVSPQAQGRLTRLFVLDYVSAADADLVIKGLLSPVGQSFLMESDEMDRRKTQEVIVVEDLPVYLERIEEVVGQLDAPPRQVLIEAHIMSVDLEDDCHHGVNWSYIQKANPALTLKTTGFADPDASPGLIFDLDTGELASVIECLKSTADTKTLASPKVFALNGQQARIQVGEQLGYKVSTTTQTSTTESVEFLEVGVILTVTPQITPDNCVLMTVKPVVSSGQINSETKVPDTETTEVETSLILRDGHGIVIGGLIQEEDIDTQEKVPFFGDLWLVGRLFQSRSVDRKRTELIVTLIPHIVPYQPECHQRESEQFYRSTTPIVHGPLLPYPRPFEPYLPDASQPPACLYRWQGWGPADPAVPDWGEGLPAGHDDGPSRPLPPAYFEAAPDSLDVPEDDAMLPGPIPAPRP